jgi:hypothetical protein
MHFGYILRPGQTCAPDKLQYNSVMLKKRNSLVGFALASLEFDFSFLVHEPI